MERGEGTSSSWTSVANAFSPVDFNKDTQQPSDGVKSINWIKDLYMWVVTVEVNNFSSVGFSSVLIN